MQRITIAEQIRAEGREEGRREAILEFIQRCQATLLGGLRDKFGPVSPDVLDSINATQEGAQLLEWNVRLATAQRVEDVGITGPS